MGSAKDHHKPSTANYREVPTAAQEKDGGEDGAYQCGIGSYRPSWMQRFATSKYYALILGMLGLFQGAYKTYLVGTLSTVEKRFSMSSGTSSIIMIADDISPVIGGFLLVLFMHRTSKPNWVASGMLMTLLGTVSSALPYSVYGVGTHLLGKPGESRTVKMPLCNDDSSGSDLCKQDSDDGMSSGPLVFLFLGNFLNGMGGMAYWVIGTAYMDDNVKKKNSALYFGAVYGCRFLGPVLGFFVSSLCLSYYENPFEDPGISAEDPRWVGAWWIGYIVIGVGIFLSCLPMFLFPRKIRSKAEANKQEEMKDASIKAQVKETAQVFRRLAKNPIYIFRTLGNIVGYIALAGYYISFPRYTEHQFQQTASRASLFAGPTYIVSNVIGTVVGSLFIHKVQPRPRVVAGVIVAVNVVAMIGIMSLLGVSCGSIKFSLRNDGHSGLTINNECSNSCACSTSIHQPVCDRATGTQYFSACFAGCDAPTNNDTGYSSCRCLSSETTTFVEGPVESGKCEQDCFGAMMIFSAVVFSIQTLLSTMYVGGTLLLLRSMAPADKSMALTIQSVALNLLAFIPFPLIYGALLDASCAVWEDRCGDRGTCWIYDLGLLRNLIHGVTTGLLAVSCCFHILVWYYSKRITNFYDDEGEEGKEIDEDAVAELNQVEYPEGHPPHWRTRTTSIESWEFQNFNKMANVSDPH
ncbi:solute carrier organic anion transporter family member 74D-like [Ornithodoros turicata]|uniref:solute carrier organic anion transporter family member 74D-like n=1 Tax=Ornithodoros turicata TaxID=34597 RepID=UPI003139B47A